MNVGEKMDTTALPEKTATPEFTLEDTLEDCFKQIIEGKPIELDIGTLNNYLHKSLGININLKPRLRSILPYMLVHFIKIWPGWKKTAHYQNNQLTFDTWYQRFRDYLVFKINFMIKNDYDRAVAMLKYNTSIEFAEKTVEMKDSSTQTNPNVEKVMAPFKIEVTGPAKLLNSLVFVETADDGVVAKEYRVAIQWGSQLSVRQLINWPFIEVEFKSKFIHFKRTNQHEYKRCLTFSSEKIFFKKSDNIIEEIDIVDENLGREAYTLNAIKEFCRLYISFLRAQMKVPDEIQKEIECIVEDFVLDVTDINMNSFATNSSVLYNIGDAIYARNKSIKTSDEPICFGECLIPRLLTTLYTFSGIKDGKIVEFDPAVYMTLLPTITFRCTFCDKSFPRSKELWTHLQHVHIMDQPVLCFRCKLQFNVSNLTENRWFHNCKPGARATGTETES